jgi:hypothetical protein
MEVGEEVSIETENEAAAQAVTEIDVAFCADGHAGRENIRPIAVVNETPVAVEGRGGGKHHHSRQQ